MFKSCQPRTVPNDSEQAGARHRFVPATETSGVPTQTIAEQGEGVGQDSHPQGKMPVHWLEWLQRQALKNNTTSGQAPAAVTNARRPEGKTRLTTRRHGRGCARRQILPRCPTASRLPPRTSPHRPNRQPREAGASFGRGLTNLSPHAPRQNARAHWRRGTRARDLVRGLARQRKHRINRRRALVVRLASTSPHLPSSRPAIIFSTPNTYSVTPHTPVTLPSSPSHSSIKTQPPC